MTENRVRHRVCTGFRVRHRVCLGFRAVICSETVGLRTRLVWDQKIWSWSCILHTTVLVLVLQVWCCFVKHDLVTLVVIMILKDTATFQVLVFIVSLFCTGTSLLWKSTVPFTYLKENLPSAFVYFWWSWSCYFGLGLKNLVLFTSLV